MAFIGSPKRIKNERGRIIIALSLTWFLATITILLIMLSDEYTNVAQALAVCLALNIP